MLLSCSISVLCNACYTTSQKHNFVVIAAHINGISMTYQWTGVERKTHVADWLSDLQCIHSDITVNQVYSLQLQDNNADK